MASYTNSFACPQCCTTTCQTLPSIFGPTAPCAGTVTNVDAAICLSIEVTHNTASTTGEWVPPSPFTLSVKADCRLYGPDTAWLMGSQTHPQAGYPALVESGSITFNAFQVSLYIPYTRLNGSKGHYNFVVPTTALPSFTCSPFLMATPTLTGSSVTDWDLPPSQVSGKFSLKITQAMCNAPPPPVAPVVTHATIPCKHLGHQIEDPSKCQCGTANLMSCDLYGSCRRTGTPLAGEPICLTCPSYQAP